MATTVNNPIEKDIYRNKVVQNHTAFSTTIENTTGKEYYNETFRNGSSKTYTNQTTVEFDAANRQRLTLGDSFRTVEGGDYSYSNEKEVRVAGDFNVITGSPEVYNNPLFDNWMDEYAEVVASKVQFEQNRGGFTNNSGAELSRDGDVDEESGSTQGMSFTLNDAQQNMQKILENTQEKLTDIERKFGYGGNIKLQSAKNILIKAGFTTSTFDSAAIDPVGMKVDKGLIFDGESITKQSTNAPYLEEKDTASNVPFGNLYIQSGNGISFSTGANGFDFTTNGSIKMVGTSNTVIGGAQVLIGSSLNGGKAGSVIVRSARYLNLESSNINIKSDDDVLIDSGLSVTKDVIIAGDLVVGGNLRVLGSIVANGDIVAGGEGGVSLLNHTHGGVENGGGNTQPPNS